MAIQLDQSVAAKLNQGVDLGGGVQLPFLAPYIWTLNGTAALKALGGAQYYGGWVVKQEDIEDCARDTHRTIPAEFILSEISTKDGGTFPGYTSRHVIVAPIGIRKAWVTSEGVRYHEYQPGTRQHVQALCYLATKEGEGQYHPWGPVILTTKGFQAKNLIDSFAAWNRHTASLRRKIAPGVPAWCFYLAVGTFGAERKSVSVGKNAKSPITPISAYLKPGLTEADLENLFVGDTVATIMAELMDEAKEWLDAWKGDPSTNQFHQSQNGYGMPEDDFIWPDTDRPEDEIPF